MFCPKCSERNDDDKKFCRICGTNLYLVQQTLTGKMPQETISEHQGKSDRNFPSLESAIRNFVTGIGFIFVSFAVYLFAPAGRIWWFWMLIPAFGMLGKAASEYFSVKQGKQQLPQSENRPVIQAPPTPLEMRPRNTGELLQPPSSVTENTTKLFDPPTK